MFTIDLERWEKWNCFKVKEHCFYHDFIITEILPKNKMCIVFILILNRHTTYCIEHWLIFVIVLQYKNAKQKVLMFVARYDTNPSVGHRRCNEVSESMAKRSVRRRYKSSSLKERYVTLFVICIKRLCGRSDRSRLQSVC